MTPRARGRPAVVSWLVVLGVLLVVAAVLGVELTRRKADGEALVPAVPGSAL